MVFSLRHLAVLVLGLVGLALSGAPSSANQQYGHGYQSRPHHGYGHQSRPHHGYGHQSRPNYGYGYQPRPNNDYGYYNRPYPTPRGDGEVVILQPPVRYAPPPAYYAPPPGYYAPAPYPRFGYYGRPGVSPNYGF